MFSHSNRALTLLALMTAALACCTLAACNDQGPITLASRFSIAESLATTGPNAGKFVDARSAPIAITFGADDTYHFQRGRFVETGHWHGRSLSGLLLIEDDTDAPVGVWAASLDSHFLTIGTISSTIVYHFSAR